MTSQIRSLTWVTPIFLTSEHVTEIDFAAVEADPAADGDHDGPVVKRVDELLQTTIDAR